MKGLLCALVAMVLCLGCVSHSEAACFQAASTAFTVDDCGHNVATFVPAVNPFFSLNPFVSLRSRFVNGSLFQPTVAVQPVVQVKVVKLGGAKALKLAKAKKKALKLAKGKKKG